MNRAPSRRSLLQAVAGTAAAASTGGLLTACDLTGQSSGGSGGVLRLGFVSPLSGDSTGYGSVNGYLLRKVRGALGQGLTSGGKKYDVEIIERDSQSDPQVAARMAADLVQRHQVDLMLCTSAPETVNPVADVCEKARTPCLSTAVPWESWYFGRGATASQPFTYTYHFFLGTTEIAAAFSSLWSNGDVPTNDVVAIMWPDGPDGDSARKTLGPRLESAHFTLVDPGAYKPGTTRYAAQIDKFREQDAEIFTSNPLPSDFITFWRQASEANFRPKIATVAKTCQLPAQVEPLGASGIGITTPCWWTPQFPYASTLTGQTAQQLASDYTGQTGDQWTQMLGSNMALFEVAVHALKTVSDPKDRQALAAHLATTSVTTMVGHLDWTSGPVKNVATQEAIMAQWRQAPLGSGFLVEPVIVDNGANKDIPLGASLRPLA